MPLAQIDLAIATAADELDQRDVLRADDLHAFRNVLQPLLLPAVVRRQRGSSCGRDLGLAASPALFATWAKCLGN